MTNTILVVEPSPSGHRPYYVRLLVEASLSAGASVIVLTSDAATADSNWMLHLGHLKSGVTLRKRNENMYDAAVEVSREVGATRTIIPDGDAYLPAALRSGWSGSGRLSILTMRAEVTLGGRFVRTVRTFAKRAVIVGAGLRSNIDVLVLRSPLTVRRGPLRWVPDPVTLTDSEKGRTSIGALLEEYGERRWVGVFGRITARKNLLLILDALGDVPETVGLLIGGAVDDDVIARTTGPIETLRRRGIAVVQLPPPISDEMLDSAITYVDCVLAAHSNEGPSGIVAKAAAAGRQLVLAGAQSLRRDALALYGQAEWVPLSLAPLTAAISRALTAPKPATLPAIGSAAFVSGLIPELLECQTNGAPSHTTAKIG